MRHTSEETVKEIHIGATDDTQIVFCENILMTSDSSTSRESFMSYRHIKHTSTVMIGEIPSDVSNETLVTFGASIRMTPDRSAFPKRESLGKKRCIIQV